MSVARFTPDSDVYVFYHVHGWWDCCGCQLLRSQSFECELPLGMVWHLRAHAAAGHAVHPSTFAKLEDLVARGLVHDYGWEERAP